jgi:hypothetical protein
MDAAAASYAVRHLATGRSAFVRDVANDDWYVAKSM